MIQARGYQTATALPNGNVLVVGGSQTYRALASAELYVAVSRSWRPAGSLSTPRMGHTATLLNNGEVLIAGGSDDDSSTIDALSSAELYDPQTNTWSPAASMHAARAYHTATLLPDGRVLVVGGFATTTSQHDIALGSAELYDPNRNTWTMVAAPATARAMHAAVLLRDGRVLLLGGTATQPARTTSISAIALNSAELFDPSTDTWSQVASMHDRRTLPVAAVLPDGRILVVGDEGVNEGTAELYDPASNRWSDARNPTALRAESIAVPLNNGQVLVAGGIGESSASLFDWRRNVWIDAGHMHVIRASGSGTLLPDGEVLVAGGFGNLSDPFASAELYDPQGRLQAAVANGSSQPWALIGVAPLLGGIVLLLLIASRLLYARPWRMPSDQWVTFPASRMRNLDD